MAKNNNLTDFVTDLADAIRAKCGTTGTINPQDFSKFVGGMPFYKFLETVDITAKSDSEKTLPLSFGYTYRKGIVYITNDNGQTTIDESIGVGIINANGASTNMISTISNTTERIEIYGFPNVLPAGYSAYFADSENGELLVGAGWHMKLDIFELCMGNPDGEYQRINLSNATGWGV